MPKPNDLTVLADRTRYEANLLEVLEETALEDRHGSVDVRGDPGETSLMLGAIVSGRAMLDDALHRLRPLLTGAAWKVLDQIVEHQLGHRPGDKNRSISAKTRSASTHSVPNPLAPSLRETWMGVQDAYHYYLEVRHGLLHRTTDANADGDIVTTLGDGVTPTNMTSTEQLAMCRLSRRLVDYLVHGRSDYTHYSDIGHQLNCLSRVTHRPWPHRDRTARTEFVDRIGPDSNYQIDSTRIYERVLGTLYTTTCIDLVLEVDPVRNLYLVGPLEMATEGEIVSFQEHPDWMVEEIRPDQRRPRGA